MMSIVSAEEGLRVSVLSTSIMQTSQVPATISELLRQRRNRDTPQEDQKLRECFEQAQQRYEEMENSTD